MMPARPLPAHNCVGLGCPDRHPHLRVELRQATALTPVRHFCSDRSLPCPHQHRNWTLLLPHLRHDWAHSRPTSALGRDSFSPASAPRLDSSLPTSAPRLNHHVAHWADLSQILSHICARTGLAQALIFATTGLNAACILTGTGPIHVRSKTGLTPRTAAPGRTSQLPDLLTRKSKSRRSSHLPRNLAPPHPRPALARPSAFHPPSATCHASAPRQGSPLPASTPGQGSCCPTSAPGLGSPRPHLERDCARCSARTGTHRSGAR